MTTPFDDVMWRIRERGFHNHRLEDHSEAMSRGILKDLREKCAPFNADFSARVIREWLDFPSPGGRARKLDLVVAEPDPNSGKPELSRLRLCIENKSVVTAHRNRTNRYDDLSDVVGVLHARRPEAILVATVLIGLAKNVLNVPDRVKPFIGAAEFEKSVLPRLSTGDQALWTDFPHAVSKNRAKDAEKSVAKFRGLPVRAAARTDLPAYDFVLLVPVRIDNVNPPQVARNNPLGIDIDSEYSAMLDKICKAYVARWHM